MDMMRAYWARAIESFARIDVQQTSEDRLWIALGLIAGSLAAGFLIGFGTRAGISRRRRATYRRRFG